MTSPWLDVPLADYEGHMALPQVGQAQLLSDAFADALRTYPARSVALLGCAGGNGLERIDPIETERVVCLDVNPRYVDEVRARFASRLPSLELVVADVESDVPSFPPVDLAFAGLLFEYVDLDRTLAAIRRMLTPDGVLVAVVQLPNAHIPDVTPSPYESLRALAPAMHLVSPEALRRAAAGHAYREIDARSTQASGGKRFAVHAFGLS
jgi:SAM-dependent methyltransferase